MMLSTLIGTNLDNDDNEREDPKVENNEESKASVILKKNKNEKYDASITSKNNHTVYKEDKSRENVNE